LEWLENNSNGEATIFERRLKDLQIRYDGLIQKYNQQRKAAMEQLKEYILTEQHRFSNNPESVGLSKDTIETVTKILDESLEWLHCNSDIDAEIYEKKMNDLKYSFDEMLTTQKNEESAAARVELETYILKWLKMLTEKSKGIKLTKDKIDSMKKLCYKDLEWLRSNPDSDAKVFTQRLGDLKISLYEVQNSQKSGIVSKVRRFMSFTK
jgi:hypothetical protein